MFDPLSRQIGDFRDCWAAYLRVGAALSPEAVEALDGLFASFEAQARALEGGGPPDLATFDEICRSASAEARVIAGVAKKLEATTTRLRSAEIVAFPLRGEG
jgi:hypothetical protein